MAKKKESKVKFQFVMNEHAHTKLKILAAESNRTIGELMEDLLFFMYKRVSTAKAKKEIPNNVGASTLELFKLLLERDQQNMSQADFQKEIKSKIVKENDDRWTLVVKST